jgi:hypothetical protein
LTRDTATTATRGAMFVTGDSGESGVRDRAAMKRK